MDTEKSKQASGTNGYVTIIDIPLLTWSDNIFIHFQTNQLIQKVSSNDYVLDTQCFLFD